MEKEYNMLNKTVKLIKDHKSESIITGSISLLLVMGIFGFSAKKIGVVMLICGAVVNKLDYQFYIKIITTLMVSIPLLIIINREDLARDAANLSVLLVAMTLIVKLIDYKHEKN